MDNQNLYTENEQYAREYERSLFSLGIKNKYDTFHVTFTYTTFLNKWTDRIGTGSNGSKVSKTYTTPVFI